MDGETPLAPLDIFCRKPQLKGRKRKYNCRSLRGKVSINKKNNLKKGTN